MTMPTAWGRAESNPGVKRTWGSMAVCGFVRLLREILVGGRTVRKIRAVAQVGLVHGANPKQG